MGERIYHDDLLAFISDARLRIGSRWFEPAQVRGARVVDGDRPYAPIVISLVCMVASFAVYTWFRSWFAPRGWSMFLPTVIAGVPAIGGIAFFFAWLKRPLYELAGACELRGRVQLYCEAAGRRGVCAKQARLRSNGGVGRERATAPEDDAARAALVEGRACRQRGYRG